MRKEKYPVADNIRMMREAHGWQQTEFAAMLGVKKERVSNWECKENNPQVEWIPIIADTLGCSINDLFGTGIPLTESQWKLIWKFPTLDDHDIETLLATADALSLRHQRSDG